MVSSLLDADESKWKLMRKHKIYAKVPPSINLEYEVPTPRFYVSVGTRECPCVFTAQFYSASSFCQDGGMEVTEWSVFNDLKRFK